MVIEDVPAPRFPGFLLAAQVEEYLFEPGLNTELNERFNPMHSKCSQINLLNGHLGLPAGTWLADEASNLR